MSSQVSDQVSSQISTVVIKLVSRLLGARWVSSCVSKDERVEKICHAIRIS